MLVPNYNEALSAAKRPERWFFGAIPSFCAALTLEISSILLINNAYSLLKPLLKSTIRYAEQLKAK